MMANPVHSTSPHVRSGLDRILNERHDLLEGRRVGLVTHAGAMTCDVTPAVDALRQVYTLAALFGPEHGITGHMANGARISSETDARTGLPVYSLYGETRKPTAEMLKGVDVLVVDMQDVGVRFYTYTWTMSYVLEAAAEHGVPVVVLDRPNPIGGHLCEGPMIEPGYESFVGRYLVPLRHGLTVGELALLFNRERGLNVDLTVVEMEGWARSMWFDETGLPWVAPSPAMPKLDTAIVYPGTCLMEGTNVSEGRGTATPFECIGAPWVDGYRLASVLNDLSLPGVRFRAVFFTPWSSKHAGETCQGVFVHVVDRQVLRPLRMGLHVLSALRSLWPDAFRWRGSSWEGRPAHFDLLVGNSWVREQIDAGRAVGEIVVHWQEALIQFDALRRKVFLYA
jgi:uncharacterized protein YbbC (DUF1343 family)